MDPGGTRPCYRWWNETSTKKLMKGEAHAWKYARRYAPDLDGYFVPIEFDQRYPEINKSEKEDSKERGSEVEIVHKENLDDNETVRTKRCCNLFKSLPFCGKTVKYKTSECIMTYEFGDKETLPTIVMLHGFAGSALLYYPLFQYLSGKYHVLAIDLLGMGCSSRPEFLAESSREAYLFFVESIELWRKEMGLKTMSLVCHSLGSYIGIKYAYEYPENVDKLVLLSPLGLQKDHSGTAGIFRRADTDSQFIRKYLYMLARLMMKNDGSPIDVLRILGRRISCWLINDYLTRRLRFGDEEKGELFEYLYQMGLSGRSGELAIGKIIELSLSTYEPTYDELLELFQKGIKVTIGFGETDFCNTKFTGRPVSEELVEQGIEACIIKGATHQVFFDQPEECVNIIDKICLDDD